MFDIFSNFKNRNEYFALNAISEYTNEKIANEGEGVVIPIRSDQEQLVRDITFLSNEQLDLLGNFVESLKVDRKDQV